MSSRHQLGRAPPASANIEHISRLSEVFLQLYNSEEYSDLTLIVAGRRFRAHKIVLAARSQYFRTLLFGSSKESSGDEVELKDANLPAFKDMLKYIYTGRISLLDKSEEVVLDIFRLARLFEFLELETTVLNYLPEILSVTNVYSIYDIALFYRLESLRNICLEFMERHAAVIIEHESFHKLQLDRQRITIA